MHCYCNQYLIFWLHDYVIPITWSWIMFWSVKALSRTGGRESLRNALLDCDWWFWSIYKLQIVGKEVNHLDSLRKIRSFVVELFCTHTHTLAHLEGRCNDINTEQHVTCSAIMINLSSREKTFWIWEMLIRWCHSFLDPSSLWPSY